MSASARKASQTYAIERTTQQMLNHYEKLVRESHPRKSSWRTRLRGLMERFSS
jgi:hypothetical protein